MSTVWILSGEASGDDYGAGLARALKAREPGIVLRGMGAEKMRAAGVDIMVDSTELGVVGFVEVFKHIFFFIRLLKQMARRAAEERPDAVVLIDYPGFNLRLAAKLKKIGIPVIYYISPQVWAWKKGRIPKIAATVRRMMCIFPFEPEVYAGTGLDARFVGHPLLQTLARYTCVPAERDDQLVIMLPGSRYSEYSRLMPAYVRTMEVLLERHPELRFHFPMRNEKAVGYAKKIIAESKCTLDESKVAFSCGDAREWMRRGTAALAASGTVTVEATILGCPVVVTYILNAITWWVARHLVKLWSVTIANLVTGKRVYEELLQDQATPEKLSEAVEGILPGGRRRQETLAGMDECVRMLGRDVDAADNVAQNVLEVIEEGRRVK